MEKHIKHLHHERRDVSNSSLSIGGVIFYFFRSVNINIPVSTWIMFHEGPQGGRRHFESSVISMIHFL